MEDGIGLTSTMRVRFPPLLQSFYRYITMNHQHTKFYIGIDPGANGGITVIDLDGNVQDLTKMPPTAHDIYQYLSRFSDNSKCVLEDVGKGMPGQSSKATATFARHNGHLEMALIALGIYTEKVTPQKWIKEYQITKRKEMSKSGWKNILKAKAQQLFPSLGPKITLSTCDALLIAEYGRRKQL